MRYMTRFRLNGNTRRKCSFCFLLVALIFLLYFSYGWQRRRHWVNPGQYHVAYPRDYHFIVDEPQKCEEHPPFLVVIVPVVPSNLEVRQTIRRTWGNATLVQQRAVTVLFLLGLPGGADAEKVQEKVRLESQEHHDVLQSNFMDTYRNLTIKTMLMLEWLVSHCPQASYAVKVDSDVFLNVRHLAKMLTANPLQENYITGYVWTKNPVLRKPSSKFYIPPHVYKPVHYPPYPLGMCYVFSMDLPRKLLDISSQIKPIFIEDAYIGLCLQQLAIKPAKPPGSLPFVLQPPEHFSYCFYASRVAVMTRNPKELLSIWSDFQIKSWC